MAMPTGNVVISDKMQYPSGGGAGGANGGEIHHHNRQWFPDERDAFIVWLKSEFAAANAIVDSLCDHLRAVGEPGEYDSVIGCVQQRRCNWNSVLHMQQYFSVAEVIYSLQQVAFRRQQRYYNPVKTGGKEYRRSGSGFKHWQRGETGKEAYNYGTEYHGNDVNSSGAVDMEKGQPGSEKHEDVKAGDAVEKSDDKVNAAVDAKKEDVAKSPADDSLKSSEGAKCCNYELDEKEAHFSQYQTKKQDFDSTPQTFAGIEMFDGKLVNVVEGLKLYENLLEETEVSKLVSLAYDLRMAGRKGQIQGPAYVALKRPMKGHGREMIQLGLQIADSPPEDENGTRTFKDRKIETIPPLLQDVIDRLFSREVMTVKPDSCIIDFYNEVDHSQPFMWPSWFGRPVSVLLLTECDMTFGRVIGSDHPGDYRGPLKLSLIPGSLLVMEGKSADLAKHAIPSTCKQRILITFTKSQPKKFMVNDRPSSAVTTSSHWSSPSNRSHNHVRHPVGGKHYAASPTAAGVLSTPPPRAQITPANGMQPMFVAAPVAVFPAPVVPIPPGSTGWTSAAPPKHSSPRFPVPGTGVFLPPPGSGNSSSPQQVTSSATDTSVPVEIAALPDKDESETQETNGGVEDSGREAEQDTDGNVAVGKLEPFRRG